MAGMGRFGIHSIRWKLTTLVAACCTIALLISCAAILVDHVSAARDVKVTQLNATAKLLAYNSTAALSFEQSDAAEELLDSLSSIETVCYARLVNIDGEPLASYSRSESEDRDDRTLELEYGHRFSDRGVLEIVVPVQEAGEILGSLYVESSLNDLWQQVYRNIYRAVLFVALSLIVSIVVTNRFQKAISEPILKLANAAKKVTSEGDYSVRVSGETSGELAALYRCFNEMLGDIERANNSLADAKSQLEIRVADRTADLHKANLKLRAEFEEKERLNAHMVELSHQAGKAEIATGVLHNVGNVLNSINVSAGLVTETIQISKLPSLKNVVDLLNTQDDIVDFMANTDRGKALPVYLQKLSGILQAEQDTALKELGSLGKHLEHVKTIVAMQQSYAGVSAVKESVTLDELIDDAELLIESSLKKHHVNVTRDFADLPRVKVEKQKLLQVIVNLMKNAKDATTEFRQTDRQLTISTRVVNEDRLHIAFADNGSGIEPQNLTRIFSHGFTTKSDGHGFGLHSCANAINEMKGMLSVRSDGEGCGATFLIDIPFQPAREDTVCLN